MRVVTEDLDAAAAALHQMAGTLESTSSHGAYESGFENGALDGAMSHFVSAMAAEIRSALHELQQLAGGVSGASHGYSSNENSIRQSFR
jgi:hypothetical protein